MATETKWRRRWKPTLAACPWQTIDVDGENLLIKMKFSEKSYEVLITDLTSFWYEALEENALKKRIQKLNPSIEAPTTTILDQIRQNVDKPGQGTTRSVQFKDLPGTPTKRRTAGGGGEEDRQRQQTMVLSFASTMAGMLFEWKFHAAPADSAMARDHLTVPLLAMVSELFRRQQELVSILATKDKEIDDYRAQGVRTSRKHIETTKFDSIAFKNSMVTSKGFEQQVRNLETATFDSDGGELYRQIVTKHAWLTHKDSGDADEEAMSEDESIPMSAQESAPSTTKHSWANRLPPSLVPSKGASPTKTPTTSPSKSPSKSPTKSPGSHGSGSGSDSAPTKDTEKLRREALERRLEQEELKKQEKKKKKKLAF